MGGVLSMFLIGLLVGGLDVVNRQDRFLWFIPQSLNGPLAFLADYLSRITVRTGTVGTIGIVHTSDIGILFVALGGLLNLATMIDCATRPLNSQFNLAPWERRGAEAESESRSSRAVDRSAITDTQRTASEDQTSRIAAGESSDKEPPA